MFGRLVRAIALVALVGLVLTAQPAAAGAHRTFVHDFDNYQGGVWLPGSAISSREVVFPEQQCGGTTGCHGWFIGGRVEQAGLVGGDYEGLITAHFTRPVSSITITAAPGVQFRAAYTVTALDANGHTVGSATRIISEDQGLPDFMEFGYYPVTADHFSAPACSFVASSKWLASSWPQNHVNSWLLGVITVRLAPAGPSSHCR